jgi:hypothetical protein
VHNHENDRKKSNKKVSLNILMASSARLEDEIEKLLMLVIAHFNSVE